MWRKFAWWLGAPAICSIWIGFAFIWPRLLLHLQPWWRVPLATASVPDVYLYYLWLGAVVQHVPLGEFFYWLIPVFRALWNLTGGRWSIPEFVVLSFILSATVTLWLFPFVLQVWSGLERRRARWFSAAFLVVWTGVLGFRPGIYSWYTPLIFLALLSLVWCERQLRQGRWLRAVLLALFGLAVSWIYPWCQLFMLTMLSLLFGEQFFRRWQTAAVLFAIMSFIASIVSIILAPIMLRPEFRAIIDQYARGGTSFSHLPYVTSLLLPIIGWLALFVALNRRQALAASVALIHGRLFLSWLVLLVLWLDYPLTGLFLFNEHFTFLVILLSAFSLAYVLSNDWMTATRRRRFVWLWPWLGVSYELMLAVRPGGSVLQYLLNIFPWFLLAMAATVRIWPRRPLFWRLSLIGMSLLAAWGYIAFLQRETALYPEVQTYAPLIAWINHDGSPQTRYCADVATSPILGAHTGRRFYPSEGTILGRETTEAYDQRLEAIAGAFDVRGSGQWPLWEYYVVTFGFGQTCDSFPFEVSLLRRLHLSMATIDALSGCPRRFLAEREQRLTQAVDRSDFPRLPLAQVCDRVIIPDRLRAYWHLPSSAKLIQRVATFELWSLR